MSLSHIDCLDRKNVMPNQKNNRSVFLSLLLPLFMLMTSLNGFSQNYRITGTLIDESDNLPVVGAYVIMSDVNDTTDRVFTTSDADGKFTISNLKRKTYILSIMSINYEPYKQEINIRNNTTDLGTTILKVLSKELSAVVVTGQGTAVQKGDTTIMKADAFKVNVDATAEDLVKKMPGITIENGSVKARGEDVDEVLVDGRPFFGNDPSVALRNLPADVIDRVQVYNRLSDQAELTGFDDGESTRAINLITRQDAKTSQFGKITGGTDFTEKYLVAGNLNIFKGTRRFTLTGMSNNVNQQNFAMQDLIGSTGGGRGSFGGRSFRGSSGISTNSSLGLNYQDNWGEKVQVSGSYFYNASSNNTMRRSNTEYLLIEDGNMAFDTSNSDTKNDNHRFNLRIEWEIDSMNSLIIVPRYSLQNNSSENQSISIISGGSVNTQTNSLSNSDSRGSNFGNDLTWRHKFTKPGRTISLRSSISYDTRTSDNSQYATIYNFDVDTIYDNQYSDGSTNNLSVNTNISYTEPLGKSSQLQLSYRNSFRRSDNSSEIFEMGDAAELLGRIDSLSNVYNNDYISNRVGIDYLLRKDKLNLSLGIDYDRSNLDGKQEFPQLVKVSETFQSWLPNVMINYKFSDITNLRMFYRTNTNTPSVTQLQTAINNSDRQRLSTGNPNLRQAYSHSIMSNFSYANPTSGFNTFIFLMGSYSKDVMTTKTIYAEGDTIYNPDGIDVTLYPGGQISYPVNLDKSMRINTMINLSYFVKPIKSNVSMVIGGGYSQSPEYVESQVNRSNSYNLTNSLIITSNISENVDFTLSYTSNYSLVKNSVELREDTKYWYQSANANLDLVFWKGFTFSTDASLQYNSGLSADYNEKYFVWNARLGKKFLKNQAAELSIGAYDILDQNKSISRSVTASYIRDSRVNTYSRYFLVLFTYNLRAGRAQEAEQEQDDRRNFYRQGGFPGGGRPSGGPPRF